MIIFAKEDGRVESSPAFIPKGSGGVPVQVFAPYFAGCTCEVWVLPPTALQLDPAILSPEFGGAPGVWAGKLPPGTAKSPGRGDYQLRFTDAEGTAVATLSGTYMVQRGVVDAYPDNMDDLSGYSLATLATLLSQFANRLEEIYGNIGDIQGNIGDIQGNIGDMQGQMITPANLPDKMEEVRYNMKLSKNILSWGISGKILASVLLTGLVGSTGCIFSEKENRESLATIIESVPIIAESESEAAEINSVRETLAEALRAEEKEELASINISLAEFRYDAANGKYRIYTGTGSPFKTYEDIEKASRISVEATYTKGGAISRVEIVDGWEVINGSSLISEAEPLRVAYGGKFGEVSFSLAQEDPALRFKLHICGRSFEANNATDTAIELAAGTTFEYLVQSGLLYFDIDFEENGKITTAKDACGVIQVFRAGTEEFYSAGSVQEGENRYLIIYNTGAKDLASCACCEIKIKSNSERYPLHSINLCLKEDPNAEYAKIDVYDSCRLTVSWLPVEGSGAGMAFYALPEGCATIARSSGGAASGGDELEVTVTAYPPDGNLTIYAMNLASYAMASFKIQVPEYIPVTGVVVSPKIVELSVGGTWQLTASVEPANATHKEVLWANPNYDALRNYISVSENGLVTIKSLPPLDAFPIYACAKYQQDIVGECIIVVTESEAVESITITPSALSLKVGETAEVSYSFTPANATNPSFEVIVPSEIEVVSHDTANRKIVIKAISAGEVALAVTTSDNSVYATCPVTVEAPPEIFVTGITLSHTSATLKVGESMQLTADVQPANAEYKEIMWYSDSDTVTVENGLVTAIALPGGKNTAIITAQSISSPSVTAACTFEIQPVLVESITITPSALSLKVGETAEVSYSFTPANATNPSFEVIVPSEPSEIEVVSHDTTNRKIVIKAISMAEVALVITTSDYSVYSTCPVTVEATDTAEDTIAYAWATVNAYSSWKSLPQLDDQYLQLKKAEASSAEDYSAAENSDINLSDESKAVTITIDGTLYDENGAVSAADSGGLLKAQLSRANGTWACDWVEFQQGGPRYTSFSASDPANIEISGSAIRIYLGKRIVGANEYQMYFTTTKTNHHIDYKITVAVS